MCSSDLELVAEDVVVDFLPRVAVLVGLDTEQLLLVVPLVQGFALVEAFVALQTDEASTSELGDALGELGLAGTGRTLDEDGLAEAIGEVGDAGDAIVGQVVDAAQAATDLLDALETGSHAWHPIGRSPWSRNRSPDEWGTFALNHTNHGGFEMRRSATFSATFMVSVASLLAAVSIASISSSTTVSGAGGASRGTIGRFSRLPLPTGGRITNLPSHANAHRVVTATVVLNADSVVSAADAASAAGRHFDRRSAAAAARSAQALLAPRIRAAGATITDSATTVINALTIRSTVGDLARVAALPGVSTVHVSRPIVHDNASSDLYTGAVNAWNDLGLTGKGLTVGIIDTGIDYYHADFGGTGAAAYAADDSTIKIGRAHV